MLVQMLLSCALHFRRLDIFKHVGSLLNHSNALHVRFELFSEFISIEEV